MFEKGSVSVLYQTKGVQCYDQNAGGDSWCEETEFVSDTGFDAADPGLVDG